MAVTSKSDKTEEMVKKAKQAKKIFEKHAAEFLRMSRFHIGQWVSEWLVVPRYSSWEAFGKAQEGLARTLPGQKLIPHAATVAQLTGRNITVSVDLR